MGERTTKSQKMTEPHVQARNTRHVGAGRVTILRGWDANRTTGARRRRGGRARVRVGVAGSVGPLTSWFDLWVQVMKSVTLGDI
jgi:hypothetical protein